MGFHLFDLCALGFHFENSLGEMPKLLDAYFTRQGVKFRHGAYFIKISQLLFSYYDLEVRSQIPPENQSTHMRSANQNSKGNKFKTGIPNFRSSVGHTPESSQICINAKS